MRFIRGGGITRATNVRSLPYTSRSRAAPAGGCLVGGSGVMEPLKGNRKNKRAFPIPHTSNGGIPFRCGQIDGARANRRSELPALGGAGSATDPVTCR